MVGVIYMVTCFATKKSYIGQTWNYRIRKQDHKRGYNSNKILRKVVKKYGFNSLEWTILEDGILTQELLDAIEISKINTYNTMVPNGYNFETGGRGGKPSLETRQKRSKSIKKLMTPQRKQNLSRVMKGKMAGNKNPNYGKKLPKSPETRAKISKKLKGKMVGKNHPMYGKKHSKESKKKMSLAKQGKNNYNYGKKLPKSLETRKKISESLKRRYKNAKREDD